jgi:hypothetical protein
LGGAAFVTIGGSIAAGFVFLTKRLVIDPLQTKLDAATTEIQPANTEGSGTERIDTESVRQSLEELGYTDVAEGDSLSDEDTDNDGDSEEDSVGS